MTLPVTGPITFGQINTELGVPQATQISLNDTAVRGMANKANGPISMADLRGKSNGAGLLLTTGADGQGGYGYYDVGGYGSLVPNSIQGFTIPGISYSPSFTVFGINLLPIGSRLTGTNLTFKTLAGVTTGTFPLASAQISDSNGQTVYVWISPSNPIGGVGEQRRVAVT